MASQNEIVDAINKNTASIKSLAEVTAVLDRKNNAKGAIGYYSNKQMIQQLIRSWAAYVDTKQVGDTPLLDYQIKEMTIFDFMEWLKKDSNDSPTNTTNG